MRHSKWSSLLPLLAPPCGLVPHPRLGPVGCVARHAPAVEPPSIYDHCVEVGPTDAGELSNFIIEWSLHADPHFRLQFAFHGRANRGYVGIGFDDTGKGLQVLTGDPATDTACIRAMFDNATELNEDGLPWDRGAELPVLHSVTDEWWTHVEIERNLSVGITGDPYGGSVIHLSLLWAYRWASIIDGTCQDFRLVKSITERPAFALDLRDPSGMYRSPVRQKVFAPGEPRCHPLAGKFDGVFSEPLNLKGYLEGERHQSRRIAVLLIGGSTDGQETLHSYGLRTGEEPPHFDDAGGFVKGGENGNNACQDSHSGVWMWYQGFSDPIGGISYFTISVWDDKENIIVDSKDVGLLTQARVEVSLEINTTIRASVTAFNHGGRSTTRESHWLRVLNEGKPLWAELFDGPHDDAGAMSRIQRGQVAEGEGALGDVLWWSDATSFSGWWRGYVREDRDGYSDLTETWALRPYSFAIGQVGHNATAVTDWADTGDEFFTRGGLDLQHGEKYYFTVRTTNCAGVTCEAASWEPGSILRDGATVDLEPPLPGVVWDSNSSQADAAYMRPWEPLTASWEGFSDALSGLNRYEWAAGKDPHPAQAADFQSVMPWTFAGTHTASSATTQEPGGTWTNSTLGDLRDGNRVALGDTVYIFVRAWDNAGLSMWARSNGTKIVEY